jgi:hypothetical protein
MWTEIAMEQDEQVHLQAKQDEQVDHVTRQIGWALATAGCLPSSLPPIEPDALDEWMEQIALQETRKKYAITE